MKRYQSTTSIRLLLLPCLSHIALVCTCCIIFSISDVVLSFTIFHKYAQSYNVNHHPFAKMKQQTQSCRTIHQITVERFSSFYDDFEGAEFSKDKDDGDDDEEEDDDDDDEDDEDEDDDEFVLDDTKVANFRSKMSIMFDENKPKEPMIIDEESGGTVDDLISFARKQQQSSTTTTTATTDSTAFGMEEPVDWAKPITDFQSIQSGCVLIGNPVHFCKDFKSPSSVQGDGNPLTNFFLQPRIDLSLLRRFGLSMPPPPELGPDRQADLIPVLLIVDHFNDNGSSSSNNNRDQKRTTKAVLLNRRTGYLLGDLEQQWSTASAALSTEEASATQSSSPLIPLLQRFCIQPVWFGGRDNPSDHIPTTSNNNNNEKKDSKNDDETYDDVEALGLEMLHMCSAVVGSKKLPGSDGLYWGGNPNSAESVASDPNIIDPITNKRITGFDFKFFVQCTVFTERELKSYVSTNEQQKQQPGPIFYTAQVSKEVLFKSRDRMGTRRAKPLWTEIMDLLGGDYAIVKEQLYNGITDSTDDDNNNLPGYFVRV